VGRRKCPFNDLYFLVSYSTVSVRPLAYRSHDVCTGTARRSSAFEIRSFSFKTSTPSGREPKTLWRWLTGHDGRLSSAACEFRGHRHANECGEPRREIRRAGRQDFVRTERRKRGYGHVEREIQGSPCKWIRGRERTGAHRTPEPASRRSQKTFRACVKNNDRKKCTRADWSDFRFAYGDGSRNECALRHVDVVVNCPRADRPKTFGELSVFLCASSNHS